MVLMDVSTVLRPFQPGPSLVTFIWLQGRHVPFRLLFRQFDEEDAILDSTFSRRCSWGLVGVFNPVAVHCHAVHKVRKSVHNGHQVLPGNFHTSVSSMQCIRRIGNPLTTAIPPKISKEEISRISSFLLRKFGDFTFPFHHKSIRRSPLRRWIPF